MFIRSLDDAIQAVAEILELPDRREQIMQSTIRTMNCLTPDARDFLADSQALLIGGGLEALQKKRRELLEQMEANSEVMLIDPEEDKLFEAVGGAIDAWRLAEVVIKVFPDVGRSAPRWQVARALRAHEAEFQTHLADAIRHRGVASAYAKTLASIQKRVAQADAPWAAKAEALKAACVAGASAEDAESLFAVAAQDDALAETALAGGDEARAVFEKLQGCLDAIKALQA